MDPHILTLFSTFLFIVCFVSLIEIPKRPIHYQSVGPFGARLFTIMCNCCIFESSGVMEIGFDHLFKFKVAGYDEM